MQPKGRICLHVNVLHGLASAHDAEHVHHGVHALHHLLMPIGNHALHDLEVPSLLAVKTGTTRAKSRVKEVVNAIAMLLLHLHGLQQDACGKTQAKKNEKKQRFIA